MLPDFLIINAYALLHCLSSKYVFPFLGESAAGTPQLVFTFRDQTASRGERSADSHHQKPRLYLPFDPTPESRHHLR